LETWILLDKGNSTQVSLSVLNRDKKIYIKF
jgi:hypothetical protein